MKKRLRLGLLGFPLLALGFNTTVVSGEEPKGPEHDVSLNEKPEVLALLARAQATRKKAETEPALWQECVRLYTEILNKYGDAVFLSRWEGDKEPEAKSYGKGLYRSAAERVMEELATMPEAGLAIYRAANDSAAQNLLIDGAQRLDVRQVEKVVGNYFVTSYGDDALAWLAEYAYLDGSYRQALSSISRLSKYPNPSVPKVPLLARTFLSQLKVAQVAEAEKTLADLTEAAKDPKNGALRIGHVEGDAALANLKERLKTARKAAPAKVIGQGGLETYFGNAQHNQIFPPKGEIGLRKWSEATLRLLGAPKGTKIDGVTQYNDPYTGQNVRVQKFDTFLVARDSWFFVTDGAVIACHSVNNPNPDRPQFIFPTEAKPNLPHQNNGNAWQNMISHITPHFATLGGDHLYVVLGPDFVINNPGMGVQGEQKPNFIVALGRKRGGSLGVESGSLLWTLEQKEGKDPDLRINTKADWEWLKERYFACSPTYVDGTLYCTLVSGGASRDVSAAAIDADTGRILWKASLCSGSILSTSGGQQPALGTPPAVNGGTVYYTTNVGAVAALEASTGNVRWIRIYDRVKSQGANPWGRPMSPSADCWGPNPPILFDDLVIVAPQDSDFIYAFDMQTGRRRWQTERITSMGGAMGENDKERLRHILGLCNGRLVVSGRDVMFIDAKSGRREVQVPLRDTYQIMGRGVVTQDDVWVSTDKGLLRIDGRLTEKGKPIGKLAKEIPWTDPATDPGNLFVAGDALLSVSNTHVSAFFDMDLLEKKLKDRIAQHPEELPNYIELNDAYHRVKRFDEGVTILDAGIAEADKRKDDSKTAELAVQMKSRKFEAFFSAGEEFLLGSKETPQTDPAKAYEYYLKSTTTAQTPDQHIRGLWKLAEAALAKKDTSDAILVFHKLLAEQGEAVFSFEARTSAKAALYAQYRIAKLKQQEPKAAEAYDKLAREELAKAQGDAKKLEEFVRLFPNSEAWGEGVWAQAQTLQEKGDLDNAREGLQRFLNAFPGSDKVAEGLARLVLIAEHQDDRLLAKGYLRRLLRTPKLADISITLPGEGAQKAGDWAKARMANVDYSKPVTRAVLHLGNGKLAEAWQAAGNGMATLNPSGTMPNELHRYGLLLDGGTRISLRSPLNSEDMLKANASVPSGFNLGQRGPNGECQLAAWMGNNLVLGGGQDILAYNLQKNGEVFWKFRLNGNVENGGGKALSVQARDNRIAVTQEGGLLTVLNGASGGQEMWHVQVEGGIFGAPVMGDGYVAVCAGGQQSGRVILYNTETGTRRLELRVPGNRLILPPFAAGDLIFVVGGDNKLGAYSSISGKILWDYSLPAGQPVYLYADTDRVAVVMNTLELVVCDPNAEDAKRLMWKAQPDGPGTLGGLILDGEDVFIAVRRQNRRGEITAYKASGGKLRWKAEASADIQLDYNDVSVEHILIGQSVFEGNNQPASAVALVNRATGKLVWSANLASRQQVAYALVDGGVVVNDGKKTVGYMAPDSKLAAQDLENLKKKVAENPGDVTLRLKFSQLLFETGDTASALKELQTLLAAPALEAARFPDVYDRYQRFRKKAALKTKSTLTFTKLSSPPKLDGTLAAWKGVEGVTLDGWANVFLTSEEDQRIPPKKDAWKGAPDVSAVFYGGYDDKALYITVVVTDDVHVNTQANASDLLNGDSLIVGIDLEKSARMSYSAGAFEVCLALNNKGETLKWRVVEKGKIVMKALETDAKVTRDENAKKTVYELVLPMEYLGMKPEGGTSFGFSFMVNDVDGEAGREKGVGVSPGLWHPKHPGQYGLGELKK